jgi:hypothetical protein
MAAVSSVWIMTTSIVDKTCAGNHITNCKIGYDNLNSNLKPANDILISACAYLHGVSARTSPTRSGHSVRLCWQPPTVDARRIAVQVFASITVGGYVASQPAVYLVATLARPRCVDYPLPIVMTRSGRTSMADADDVRRLALALPGVQEIDSDGFDFRVAGKGFVWSYPERAPGQPRRIRTDIAVLYVGDEGEKQALLLGEPGLFFTAPGYEGWPLVLLRLAEVDVQRLTELVTDAWRMRAPESLAAGLDESGGLPGASPGAGDLPGW